MIFVVAAGHGVARDLGQWGNVSPEQRAWALAQLVPDGPEKGKSCCSTADGAQAIETMREGVYWVTFEAGPWGPVGPMPVPWHTVLQGSKFGPKVWWHAETTEGRLTVKIRCYAPGPQG